MLLLITLTLSIFLSLHTRSGWNEAQKQTGFSFMFVSCSLISFRFAFLHSWSLLCVLGTWSLLKPRDECSQITTPQVFRRRRDLHGNFLYFERQKSRSSVSGEREHLDVVASSHIDIALTLRLYASHSRLIQTGFNCDFTFSLLYFLCVAMQKRAPMTLTDRFRIEEKFKFMTLHNWSIFYLRH